MKVAIPRVAPKAAAQPAQAAQASAPASTKTTALGMIVHATPETAEVIARALEQRRDAPAGAEGVNAPEVMESTPATAQAEPTPQELAAAIAEGAATPLEQLAKAGPTPEAGTPAEVATASVKPETKASLELEPVKTRA
jgi:hypothetical protein